MFWFKVVFVCSWHNWLFYFNTSYVLVQVFLKPPQLLFLFHFNTSYVLVQGLSLSLSKYPSKFQYIICFGSRLQNYLEYQIYLNFNTSYVLVQVIFFAVVLYSIWFQYIICFGSSIIFALLNGACGLFQYIICFGSRQQSWQEVIQIQISIHHMFWFKIS